jgi:hypothetical protein
MTVFSSFRHSRLGQPPTHGRFLTVTSNEPTTRDNAAIARRAATELDYTSPLSGSPVFANIALRGILHALLALVDQTTSSTRPSSTFPSEPEAERTVFGTPTRTSKPATRKTTPTKAASK